MAMVAEGIGCADEEIVLEDPMNTNANKFEETSSSDEFINGVSFQEQVASNAQYSSYGRPPPLDQIRSDPNFMTPGYGKSPEFIVRLPKTTAGLLGNPVFLECRIDGNPLPDIMWTKDDDDITESDDSNYSFELDAIAGLCRLTIEKCRNSDDGTYRCILENCFGACSSTTSLHITSPSSRSPSSSTDSASLPQLPQQPQGSPVVIRELTTISEHLSQEDCASITSPGKSEDSIFPGDQRANQTPIKLRKSLEEIPVASEFSKNVESSAPSASSAEELGRYGSSSVRTVINTDPPHWRQLCITPVKSSSEEDDWPDDNSEEEDIEQQLYAEQESELAYAEQATPPYRRRILQVLETEPVENPKEATIVPETRQVEAKNEDKIPEEVHVSVTLSQIMSEEFKSHETTSLSEQSKSHETTSLSEQSKSHETTSLSEQSKSHESQSFSEEAELQETKILSEIAKPRKTHMTAEETKTDETPILPEEVKPQETQILPEEVKPQETPILPEEVKPHETQILPEEVKPQETQIYSDEVKTQETDVSLEELKPQETPILPEKVIPRETHLLLEETKPQRAHPSLGPTAHEDRLSLSQSQQQQSPPVAYTVHRTMSSPSAVPSQRRNSFIDYLVSSTNQHINRREAVTLSLIAVQITFLVFLAVMWQEHIMDSLFGSQESEPEPTKVSSKNLEKAAVGVVCRQISYLEILTTPLSFLFVLIVSTFFTFIFANIVRV